jgi:hypothetical protein
VAGGGLVIAGLREAWIHAVVAYEDSRRLLTAHWLWFAIMLGAIVAAGVAGYFAARWVDTRIGQALVIGLLDVAVFYAIAPYLVTLFRLLVLGEAASRPESIRNEPATLKFFAWASVFAFVLTIPEIMSAVVVPNGPIYFDGPVRPPNPRSAPRLLVSLINLGLTLASLRVTTLLPATALGAADVSVREAWRATRGHFWFIATTCLLAMLPLGVTGFIVGRFATFLPKAMRFWVMLPVSLFLTALGISISTSIAARLYQRFGPHPSATTVKPSST